MIGGGEEIENKLHKFILSYKESGLPWFLVIEPKLNETMGGIGLWRYKTGEIEVGYALYRKFWGQGYATEALSAILKWAKKNIDADYIIAVTTMNNVASSNVLKKCGMQFYKIDIDEGEECQFYKIKNREYKIRD